MYKKVIAILLTLTLTSVFAAGAAYALEDYSEFFDFNSGTLENKTPWVLTNTSDIVLDSTTFADKADYKQTVKITGNTDSQLVVMRIPHNSTATTTLTTGNYVIEADIYLADSNVERGIGGRYESSKTQSVVSFGTGSGGGNISVLDLADTLPYSTNVWYRVKCAVNLDIGYVEATINGGVHNNAVISGFPSNLVTDLQRLGFIIQKGTSTTYLDNMKFCTVSSLTPVLDYAEDFEAFTDTTPPDIDDDSAELVPVTNSRGTYAKLTSTASGNHDVSKTFDTEITSDAFPVVLFSADVKFDDTSVYRRFYLRGRNTSNSNKAHEIVTFRDDTNINFMGSKAEGVSYKTGQWYRIRILYNSASQNVKFYLNGVLTGESQITEQMKYINEFYFRQAGADETSVASYIDNLSAKTPTSTALQSTSPEDLDDNFVYRDGIFLRFGNLVDTEKMTVLIDGSADYVDAVLPSGEDDCTAVIYVKNLLPLTSYTITISDIYDIFGAKLDDITLSFTTSSKYIIGQPVYSTDNFVTETDNVQSGEFKTKINISANDAQEQTICVISAVYAKESNTMTDIDYSEHTLSKANGYEAEFICAVTVPDSNTAADDYKIITYIWDGITTIQPLALPIGLSVQ